MFEYHPQSSNDISGIFITNCTQFQVLPDYLQPTTEQVRELPFGSCNGSMASSIITLPIEDQDFCELLEMTEPPENAIFTIYGKAIDLESNYNDLSQYWSEDLMYRGIELIYVLLDDWELRQVAIEIEPRLVILPPMQLIYIKHADAFVASFKAYVGRTEMRVHVTFNIHTTTQSMHILFATCVPYEPTHTSCCCFCRSNDIDPNDIVHLRFFTYA